MDKPIYYWLSNVRQGVRIVASLSHTNVLAIFDEDKNFI